jgi:hypothetical protein
MEEIFHASLKYMENLLQEEENSDQTSSSPLLSWMFNIYGWLLCDYVLMLLTNIFYISFPFLNIIRQTIYWTTKQNKSDCKLPND